MLVRLAPFKVLDHTDRKKLLDGTRVVRANRHRLLVQKGDRISGAYLVIEGMLRIYSMNAAGKEATLYRLRAGEVCLLSLNAVFSGSRYPAWVSVESASVRVAVLPGTQIRRIFGRL